MGGLWEAAVKSAKTHLYKVLSNVSRTFGELYTVLTQVESCLNSRPLCALSDSPDNSEALTPGHFLVGHALNLLPEPGIPNVPVNRLDNWQLWQKLTAEIWSRWRNEYVSSLLPRTTWQYAEENLEINRLVLVKKRKYFTRTVGTGMHRFYAS